LSFFSFPNNSDYITNYPDELKIFFAMWLFFGFVSIVYNLFVSREIPLTSKAQKKQGRLARRFIKNSKKLEGIEFVRAATKLNGFVFELAVLYAIRKQNKKARKFFPVKLTGDGGIDGAFVLNNVLFIIQSKCYNGHVNKESIIDIGKVAKYIENTERKKAKKSLKDLVKLKTRKSLIVAPILVTTGNVSSLGQSLANRWRVTIIGKKDLPSLFQEENFIFKIAERIKRNELQ